MPGKPVAYFEDYQLGQKGATRLPFARRTVTEADITNFAGLTSDYSWPHVDRHYMLNSIYGERVAHGLLGFTMATGLLSLNVPHILGRANPGAYPYSFEANYRNGLKVGETVTVGWQIEDKTEPVAYPGFGLVKTAFQLLNQDNSLIYDGHLATLVRKQSAKDAKLALKPGKPWHVVEYSPDPDRTYYVEDLPMGKGGITEGRTISETDIINYSGVSGEYNPQYTDVEYAKKSMFGERIAPGVLIFDIAFGLWTWQHFGRFPAPKVKFAGHLTDRSTFIAPVKIGDTIRCQYRIASARLSKTRPGAGIVTIDLQVLNQRDELVQDGSTVMMIPSRGGSSK